MPVNAIKAFAKYAVEDLVVVCCGCQRLRVGPLSFGRRVDANVRPDRISHTLCPECAEFHYGFSRERYEAVVCKHMQMTT